MLYHLFNNQFDVANY